MRKLLLLFVMLTGFTMSAQTFDFNCGPPPDYITSASISGFIHTVCVSSDLPGSGGFLIRGYYDNGRFFQNRPAGGGFRGHCNQFGRQLTIESENIRYVVVVDGVEYGEEIITTP